MSSVYGERRLPDSWHSVDHMHRQRLTTLLRVPYGPHQRLELGGPVGERGGVARQGPQHEGSTRRLHPLLWLGRWRSAAFRCPRLRQRGKQHRQPDHGPAEQSEREPAMPL